MNMIGRIITAVICVMSIGFLFLSVAVLATHKNWKEMALANKSKVEELEQVVIRMKEELENSKKNLATEQASRRQALASLNTASETQGEALASTNEQLRSAQSAATQNAETLKSNTQILEKISNELVSLRTDLQNVQDARNNAFDQLVKTSEDLNASEATLANLKERHKQLMEDTAKYKEAISRLEIPVDQVVNDVPHRVDGIVNKIGKDELIEISLGSDDGIREGYELDVYRPGQYVGRVRVTKVTKNSAVARILRDYRKAPIKEGDRVATKLT